MIYLVRHGEAAAGWGDHPDPGLSALGQKQAKAVAVELQKRGATIGLDQSDAEVSRHSR